MISRDFDFYVTHFDELPSTNIYALEQLKNKALKSGAVVQANYQNSGKGQRGNVWHSEKGKNLLFSVLLSLDLKIDAQFLLSQAVSLGIKRYLDSLSVGQVSIKWPNDILVAQEKIAGILIENSIEGNRISDTVIGIGFNLNQTQFPVFERKACSLKQILGREFSKEVVLEGLLSSIKEILLDLDVNQPEYIQNQYLKALYGYKEEVKFRDVDGEFYSSILGLEPSGKLILERNGINKAYDLKELQFIAEYGLL